jgi:uncharacterized protein (TIGR00251 family)
MCVVKEWDGGIVVKITVQPKASSAGIVGTHAGMLKVKVNAPPEKGKANRAVLELLAAKLGCPKSSVRLLGGEQSRRKTVALHGVSKERFLALISR